MPIHIEGAVEPSAAWPAKVSQRKAPGAISAMAFMVKPVKPSVGFISAGASAIAFLLQRRSFDCHSTPSGTPAVTQNPSRSLRIYRLYEFFINLRPTHCPEMPGL